ncbi:MAG: hypothetical protein ACRC10_12580 [Thermoguttaceae bacterium]
MQVLIQIPEHQTRRVLETLAGFAGVHTQILSSEKTTLREELLEALRDVRLDKKGCGTCRNVDELIDEL